ncbi:lysosome-associated membrane glycoprotein 2 isoform X2 [Genypterus blacodes]|uniref:lysosome-associated membrane glycoprotein 2 isoform X2 n=1 Tax=Genypterus blacodes TaxID=154954 RepID=UPI003F75FAB4
MAWSAVLLSLLMIGIEFQLSHGVEVSISKDDKLCLYGELMVNFTVKYESVGNTTKSVEFPLPENVTTVGSSCGDKSSVLKLAFGDGHSWSVTFTNDGKTYQATNITFSYNLSDAATFPNSSLSGNLSVDINPHIADVEMDTCYLCKSKDTLQVGMVNQTLWNVLIQAFVNNGSKSEKHTTCAADTPATTAAPTTHVTSTTTPAPTTTTPAPTTTAAPAPTLPTPTVGNYMVKDVNATCLLAEFALRIGFTQDDKYVEMNFEPNGTTSSGKCGVNSSELVLTSDTITIMLSFINETNKFHLNAVNVTAKPSAGEPFSNSNSTLNLWEASLGSSYMCNAKQNYTITENLTLFTFNLHVQPFGVNNNLFSTAHECTMDDSTILIPIVVGAALVGLILIVVIAYVIGRRKTYVGYQTL